VLCPCGTRRRSPALASSLFPYDALRARRLLAALVQAQRDVFGAHTYERVDRPGSFGTLWTGTGEEVVM
jgi:6-phosphogluconate dehydrogenase